MKQVTKSKEQKTLQAIIKQSIVENYGISGYSSIMKTAINKFSKTEKEITTNLELFEKAISSVFGELGIKKIVEPIKDEIKKTDIHTDIKFNQNSKINLLIADDEPRVLKLYKEWLQLNNKDVTIAEDGIKCLDIYKKEHMYSIEKNISTPYDIVILDYKMPKMDGLKTAIEILKLNPKQRIIFATGYLEKTLSDSIDKLGKAVEIIQKPFAIEDLEKMIVKKEKLEKLEEINELIKINKIENGYEQILSVLTH